MPNINSSARYLAQRRTAWPAHARRLVPADRGHRLLPLRATRRKPSYTAVQTSLNPADTNRVTQALASAGVTYKVVNGGTEVDVAREPAVEGAGRARRRRASARATTPSLADMSTSLEPRRDRLPAAGQRTSARSRARSPRTIEGIDGVTARAGAARAARRTRSSRTRPRRHARRCSSTDNGTLDGVDRRAASRTWSSSSVQGLDPERRHGHRQPGAAALAGSRRGRRRRHVGATAKLQAEQQAYDAQVAARSTRCSRARSARTRPRRGSTPARPEPGRRTTRSRTTATGVPLVAQKDDETLSGKRRGRGRRAPAPAATSRRSTSAAPAARAAGRATPTRRARPRTASNKVISHETSSRRARSRSRASRSSSTRRSSRRRSRRIKNTVAGMVGLDPEPRRHDHDRRPCRSRRSPARRRRRPAGPLGVPLSIMDIVKYVVGGIGSVVFLFLVRKNLKRREGEARRPEPTWLREISEPHAARRARAEPRRPHAAGAHPAAPDRPAPG